MLACAPQEASNALASGDSASAIWRDGRTVNAAVLALQPPPSDDLAAAVPAWAVLADTQAAMQVGFIQLTALHLHLVRICCGHAVCGLLSACSAMCLSHADIMRCR